MHKWFVDEALEYRGVAFENREFFFAIPKHVADDSLHHAFLHIHVHCLIEVRHFRIHHPQLR